VLPLKYCSTTTEPYSCTDIPYDACTGIDSRPFCGVQLSNAGPGVTLRKKAAALVNI
jgi:hypothetical protein